RRMHLRDAGPCGEQADLRLRKVKRLEVLYLNVVAFELDRAADRTRACKRIQLADREIALLEDAEHRADDQARCTHNRHIPTSAHRRAFEYRKELRELMPQSRRTARSTVVGPLVLGDPLQERFERLPRPPENAFEFLARENGATVP